MFAYQPFFEPFRLFRDASECLAAVQPPLVFNYSLMHCGRLSRRTGVIWIDIACPPFLEIVDLEKRRSPVSILPRAYDNLCDAVDIWNPEGCFTPRLPLNH